MKFYFTIFVLFAIIGLSNANAQIPTDSLVGYWPFNGNANDESGNGNNGTVNGATLCADRFGNANSAYSFDGVLNNISLSQSFLDSAFSISVWVKVPHPQIGINGGAIFANGVTHGSSGDGFWASIWQANDGVSFKKCPISTGFQLNSPIGLNDSSFHHFIFIWDGLTNSNSVKVYYDGVLLFNGACSSSIINASQNLVFGFGSDGGFDYPFKGILDDIRLYNRVLTDPEILALYNESLPSCLVAYYPFNGNANDASGNGNNGTVYGATLTTDRFGNANSAYYFDGNSNITLNQSFLNGAFTISLWIKVTDPQPGNYGGGSIFSNGLDHGVWGNGFHAGINTANNSIGFQKYPITDGFGLNNTIALTDSSYHQLIYIWDGLSNSNSAKVYHNGILLFSGACSSSIINASQNLTFGFSTDGGATYPFKGKLDDIRIYNCVLDSTEIISLYNEGLCFQTITVTDTLIINAVITGYNPVTFLNTIKIYPNPTMDQITIDYGNYSTMSGYTLKITNSLGQTVFTNPVNTQQSVVNLSTWTGNGVYFVYLMDAQSNIIDIKKIVLQ